jgi:hypothetical protein
VQATCRRAGLRAELSREQLPEPTVLGEGLYLAPQEGVQAHQTSVRLFVGRVLSNCPPQGLDGRAIFPSMLVHLG